MKKLICIIISLMLMAASFTAVSADNGHGHGSEKHNTKYEQNFKKLSDQMKKYFENLAKRNDLLKEIEKLKKKYSDKTITVFLDGNLVELDSPPVLKDKLNRMLIPVAPIVKAMGATITVDPKTNTVTIKKDGITIVLKPGTNYAMVNGVRVKLDDYINMNKNRMVVPLSFIIKVLQHKIVIDEDSGTIIIDEDKTGSVNDNVTGSGNAQFEYSDGWSYGAQQCAYMNDNHWSDVTGKYYQVRFSGTQIKLYGAKAPIHGIAFVSIDGGTPTTVDYYSSSRRDNTLLFTSPILTDGQHILKVQVSGAKNTAATGTTITADRVDIISKGGSGNGNLALRKIATASSVYSQEYTADKAFDGNTGTRWSSKDSDPQWISVDLGAVNRISRVKLSWEAAYAKSYILQVSTNGTDWVQVYSTSAGDGGLDDITFTATDARYVRMLGLTRAVTTPGWGYSLYEFEVYKDAGGAPIVVPGRYEAENAVLAGSAAKSSEKPNYSGTGYVTNLTTAGSMVQFSVNAEQQGIYKLSIRYSNGNADTRTLSMYANSVKRGQLQYVSTSNWSTWSDKIEYVNLNAGQNYLSFLFENGDTGNINLDYISIEKYAGNLSGSMSDAHTGTVNLSSEGTLDWAHWGYSTATGFNHKAGIVQQISNYTTIGTVTPALVSGTANPVKYTWTDGTPAASVTDASTSIYLAGKDNGFTFTVPADTTQKTLKIYAGAWDAKVKLEATLSDGSSAPYIQEFDIQSGIACKVFTINYKAASNGQSLVVKYTVTEVHSSNFGNITLQAATLK